MAGPSGRQQSEDQATANGITALESAFTGVQNCRQDVENMKNNLSSGYKGGDGGAYQKLLEAWDRQAEIISVNLQNMTDTLEETRRAKGMQQVESSDAIEQQRGRADAIFNALHG
ncbi:WXG100 family type VII secretion target [Streptomyces sp. NPDC088116]|uniref:WXG100 family type VII secretion target n=1 Tax=Streptomyces sp. NPDC088116 TaxID=3365825 RepID=UPI003809436D